MTAESAPVAAPPAPTVRLRWWKEVAYIAAFYLVYSSIRVGVEGDRKIAAFTNAKRIIRIERLLGSFHEETIQELFLPLRWFIKFWNVYYGSFHFLVTIYALLWCYRKLPQRYPRWRNTLACTTGLALIGFRFFPLMPPRLLPTSYGFVDTLEKIGGLWAFSDLKGAANQYAAMPSLHIGWSVWCACMLWPWAGNSVRRKALLVAYPSATFFAIVVTANHFWLDAVGGALTLLCSYLLAGPITRYVSFRGRDQKIA